jgi:hypothetical protein
MLQTPRRKSPEESNLENKGTRKCAPLFLSNNLETPCSEKYGKGEVVHHLTGKLFPQVHDEKLCSYYIYKSVANHCGFFKEERTNNFVLHQSAQHIDLW